jgi:hypothetical protein
MTSWLAHQEAVLVCTAYLCWAIGSMDVPDANLDGASDDVHGHVHAQSGEDGDGDGDGDRDGDGDENEDEDDMMVDSSQEENPDEQLYQSLIEVAKHCPMPKLAVPLIKEKFGAAKFLQAVHSFVQQHLPKNLPALPQPHDHFDFYKQVVIHIPPLDVVGEPFKN